MADLRGGRDVCLLRGSKFFQFRAVFGKFCQNRMLATPQAPEGYRPHLREILDPPLYKIYTYRPSAVSSGVLGTPLGGATDMAIIFVNFLCFSDQVVRQTAFRVLMRTRVMPARLDSMMVQLNVEIVRNFILF